MVGGRVMCASNMHALSCCWSALGQILVGTNFPSSRARALQAPVVSEQIHPQRDTFPTASHAKYLQLQCLAPAVGIASKHFFPAHFLEAPCLKLQ